MLLPLVADWPPPPEDELLPLLVLLLPLVLLPPLLLPLLVLLCPGEAVATAAFTRGGLGCLAAGAGAGAGGAAGSEEQAGLASPKRLRLLLRLPGREWVGPRCRGAW